jgi:hypothetical protein
MLPGSNAIQGTVGTVITITGKRLLGGGATANFVTIGDTRARVLESNDTQIIIEAGIAAPSTETITIISDSGATVVQQNAFTYLSDCSINALSPARGQRGTYVNIYGTNMACGASSVSTVNFGDTQASVIEQTSSYIRVRAKESFSIGLHDVILKASSGALVVDSNGWTYDVPSNITDACT